MHKSTGSPPSAIGTRRLEIVERGLLRPTMFGPMRCVVATALTRDEPMPTLVVATVLLAQPKSGWLLSHLLVEDEARRDGVATEIVRFYEERIGLFGAAWVSPAGEAFARRYVEKHGPRPQWQIGTNPDQEAVVNAAIAVRKAGAT